RARNFDHIHLEYCEITYEKRNTERRIIKPIRIDPYYVVYVKYDNDMYLLHINDFEKESVDQVLKSKEFISEYGEIPLDGYLMGTTDKEKETGEIDPQIYYDRNRLDASKTFMKLINNPFEHVEVFI